MKRLFCIILFLISANAAFACFCEPPKINDSFIKSHVVVFARVEKVYPNASENDNFFRIRIDPVSRFKGPAVTELLVFGSGDGEKRTSCDVYVAENTLWMFYAEKEGNELKVYPCAGSRRIDLKGDEAEYPGSTQRMRQTLDRELELLTYLKENASSIKPGFVEVASNVGVFFKRFQNTAYDEPFGQYLITFSDSLKVVSIKVMKGLDQDFDEHLLAYLKNEVRWRRRKKDAPPEPLQYLFGVFRYREGGRTYLSDFNH